MLSASHAGAASCVAATIWLIVVTACASDQDATLSQYVDDQDTVIVRAEAAEIRRTVDTLEVIHLAIEQSGAAVIDDRVKGLQGQLQQSSMRIATSLGDESACTLFRTPPRESVREFLERLRSLVRRYPATSGVFNNLLQRVVSRRPSAGCAPSSTLSGDRASAQRWRWSLTRAAGSPRCTRSPPRANSRPSPATRTSSRAGSRSRPTRRCRTPGQTASPTPRP